MKILALVPPDKSGQQPSRYSFLSEELTAMARRGIAVHTISAYVSEPKESDGILIHPVPRRSHVSHSLRAALSIFSATNRRFVSGTTVQSRFNISRYNRTIQTVLREERIDVVYSPFAWPFNTAGVPAAKAVGVPVVVSLRGADVLVEESIGYGCMLDPALRSQMSKTLRHAEHVVAVSAAIAQRGTELGADLDRVSVILKGVNHRQFSPGNVEEARRRIGLLDRPTVLFVGNLIARKAPGLLLEAFQISRKIIPQLQLVICGNGAEMNSLEKHIRNEHIGSHVRLAGRIERNAIPDYFRACDVFVLPSLTEGSGNVLVEAGACGKPVVGTNVAGIPDYIDDGVTGFLFKKANPEDLADKLVRILSNPQLAKRMGEEARLRVEQEHTYGQMLDQLEDVFQRAIDCRGKKNVVQAV